MKDSTQIIRITSLLLELKNGMHKFIAFQKKNKNKEMDEDNQIEEEEVQASSSSSSTASNIYEEKVKALTKLFNSQFLLNYLDQDKLTKISNHLKTSDALVDVFFLKLLRNKLSANNSKRRLLALHVINYFLQFSSRIRFLVAEHLHEIIETCLVGGKISNLAFMTPNSVKVLNQPSSSNRKKKSLLDDANYDEKRNLLNVDQISKPTIQQMENMLSKGSKRLVSGPKVNQLPPPEATAKKLKQTTIQFLETWNGKYASKYIKFKFGYEYVENVLKQTFPEFRKQEEQKASQLLASKTQNLYFLMYSKNICLNFEKFMKNFKSVCEQMKNCFEILVPPLDCFENVLNERIASRNQEKQIQMQQTTQEIEENKQENEEIEEKPEDEDEFYIKPIENEENEETTGSSSTFFARMQKNDEEKAEEISDSLFSESERSKMSSFFQFENEIMNGILLHQNQNTSANPNLENLENNNENQENNENEEENEEYSFGKGIHINIGDLANGRYFAALRKSPTNQENETLFAILEENFVKLKNWYEKILANWVKILTKLNLFHLKRMASSSSSQASSSSSVSELQKSNVELLDTELNNESKFRFHVEKKQELLSDLKKAQTELENIYSKCKLFKIGEKIDKIVQISEQKPKKPDQENEENSRKPKNYKISNFDPNFDASMCFVPSVEQEIASILGNEQNFAFNFASQKKTNLKPSLKRKAEFPHQQITMPRPSKKIKKSET